MSDCQESRRKVIIDTDCGIDDAQAIMMALETPGVDIIALLAVHGNTNIDNVFKNIKATLSICQESKIPIFEGCQSSLIGNNAVYIGYHGENGLGDAENAVESLLDPSMANTPKEIEHAANALIRLAQSSEHRGELELICLGPLTNIALALKLYPDLGKCLKSCAIMGGNYKGRGNVTPQSEFNFHSDPEAATLVLRELKCPITLVCWETCEDYAITWKQYHEVLSSGTVKSNFMKIIEKNTLEKFYKGETYNFADQFAMAAALWRTDFVQKSITMPVRVEIEGGHRGQLSVDWWQRYKGSKDWPSVEIITEIDLAYFLDSLKTIMDN